MGFQLRRGFLRGWGSLAVAANLAPLGLRSGEPETHSKQRLGIVIHSFAVRLSKPLSPEFDSIATPIAFLEHARQLGAGSIQLRLDRIENPRQFQERAKECQIELEGMIALPKTLRDLERFESELAQSKEAGATLLRTVCMSGRRYEVMRSKEDFDDFAKNSFDMIRLAEPIARKHAVVIAIENHKDWRSRELHSLLTKISSEHLGVCFDFGNNIALLEEPETALKILAPWVKTTHIKDMAIESYDEGFKIAEVPLGDGLLNIESMIKTIQAIARPIALNLEMITRDPLKVPYLTLAYANAMPPLDLETIAKWRSWVASKQSPHPLAMISDRTHRYQLALEASNIAKSFHYAEDKIIWS